MGVLQLLASDNFITYNKVTARLYGVNAAILLGVMCSYQNSFQDKEFYKEQHKISEDTCLSEYEIQQALKILKNNGIINVIKKGLPAKNYYKVVEDKLQTLLTTSDLKNGPLVAQKIDRIYNNNTKNNNTRTNNTGRECVYNTRTHAHKADFCSYDNIIPQGKYNNVYLLDGEYEQLMKDIQTEQGNEIFEALDKVEEAIQFLSEYLYSHPKKNYGSHFTAIKDWVFTAIKEREIKQMDLELKERELKQRQERFARIAERIEVSC